MIKEEIRLKAYYEMRNHFGAKVLEDTDMKKHYLRMYHGIRIDHGKTIPDCVIRNHAQERSEK